MGMKAAGTHIRYSPQSASVETTVSRRRQFARIEEMEGDPGTGVGFSAIFILQGLTATAFGSALNENQQLLERSRRR